MSRVNQSKTIFLLLLLSIFCFLLFLNIHSPMLCDDFSYCFSFDTGKRIESILEIFPSMAAHAKLMNGRLISHFFVQLFLMFPPTVFDIINAAIFTLQIFLMCKLSSLEKPQNNLLLAVIFCGMWRYQRAFGQSNLWLCGSCNYLWNVVVSLLFIKPYVEQFMLDRPMKKGVFRALFPLWGFITGAYGECGSAAAIGIAGLIYMLCIFYQHKKVEWLYVFSLFMSCAGYLFMISCPAAGGHMDPLNRELFLSRFLRTRSALNDVRPMLVSFSLFLLMSIAVQVDKKRIILAVTFLAAALGSNFILVFAPYYPPRVSIHLVVYLVLANSVLLYELIRGNKYRLFLIGMSCVFIISTYYFFVRGTYAVCDSGAKMRANAQLITECKQRGETDIIIPDIWEECHYSEVWGTFYLSRYKNQTWPNSAIAKYYDVNSVTSDYVALSK